MKNHSYLSLELVVAVLVCLASNLEASHRYHRITLGGPANSLLADDPVEWPEDCGNAPAFDWQNEKDAFCLNTYSAKRRGRPRIAGGYKATLGAFPAYVRVETTKEDKVSLCGGTLIAKDVVLTAGHCMKGAKSVKVYAGYVKQKKQKEAQTSSGGMICSPNVPEDDDGTPREDVAFIRLVEPLKFTEVVQPACIAAEKHHLKTGTCFLIGFGRTENSTDQSKDLRALPVIRSCDYESIDIGDIAKIADKSKDRSCYQSIHNDRRGQACLGDSGSPVFCNNKCDDKARLYVVASVSYGGSRCVLEPRSAMIAANFFKMGARLKNMVNTCFREGS